MSIDVGVPRSRRALLAGGAGGAAALVASALGAGRCRRVPGPTATSSSATPTRSPVAASLEVGWLLLGEGRPSTTSADPPPGRRSETGNLR